MPPPRLKPCPACAAPMPVAAATCRLCGHKTPRKVNPGIRAAPGPDDRLRAAMARADWQPGKPIPPIIGKRRAAKPEIVLRIAALAKHELTVSEIARMLNRTESGIRRYVKDYGICILVKYKRLTNRM